VLNRSVILSVVLAISSLALAQQQSQQGTWAATGSPFATTDCAEIFTSGTGHNTTQFCVTANGNITQFSRGGDEYIRVGGFSEGYGICDADTFTSYFDYASTDSANLGPATFTSTASQAVSTRTTGDGVWEITNTITKIAASKSGPGAAKVSMKIKNLSSVTRGLTLVRVADVDFLSNGAEDLNNDFNFTSDRAYGLEPGFRSGLSLTNNSFISNAEIFAFTLNVPIGLDPCHVFTSLAPQPFFGDGSIAIVYALGIPKGVTRTFNLTYQPI
jgi:hypothetical protein